MGVLGDTGDVINKVTDRHAKTGISACVIAALVTVVCVLITSFKYDKAGIQFSTPPDLTYAFIVAFMILFVGSWFVLYILQRQDGIDVYDAVRRNLTGDWIATYAQSIGERSKTEVVGLRNVICKIYMGIDKKLVFTFIIHEHPLFADDKQEIRDAAVRYDGDGQYVLMYYYKSARELNERCKSRVLDIDRAPLRTVDIEIFGRLTFESREKEKVTLIQGNWYDLNGNMSRLYAFRDEEISKNGNIEPMRLIDVQVQQKNFDADMGEVKYTRS